MAERRPEPPVEKPAAAAPSANGAKAVDFVSEDDVKRAIQKGEKIYITARTIITPAARDIGEPAEVFAKILVHNYTRSHRNVPSQSRRHSLVD